MAKRRPRATRYVTPKQQRCAAKWRIAGLRANLIDAIDTHAAIISPYERAELFKVYYRLARLLETWTNWPDGTL